MKFVHTLMLGVAAAGLMASGAQAADLLLPADPAIVYDDVAFSFEGFYLGVQGGAAFVSDGFGTHGLVGVVAGANFLVSDAILAGLEFQADAYFNGGGYQAADALILGRIGAVVTDNVLIYAAGGVGFVNYNPAFLVDEPFWTVGGGIEMGVTDNLGVRGEILYKQAWDTAGAPDSSVQATLGLLWHLN